MDGAFSGGRGDYEADTILGLIPGSTRTAQIGERFIATAFSSPTAGQDIWGGATNELSLPSAGEDWEIVSDSANDTAAGTGAQTVSLTILDASYNQLATVTVSMSGTTPVSIPGGAVNFRLNAAVIGGAATSARRRNAGTITIRQVGTGTVRGIIPPGAGSLQQCIYTVPTGFNLVIYSIEVQILSSGGGTARGADFLLQFRNPNGATTAPRKFGTTDVQPYSLNAQTNIRVSSTFDFIIQCIYTSNNNMRVAAAWEGILRKA